MRRVTCQKSVRYDMHARISPYVCLSPADGESSATDAQLDASYVDTATFGYCVDVCNGVSTLLKRELRIGNLTNRTLTFIFLFPVLIHFLSH